MSICRDPTCLLSPWQWAKPLPWKVQGKASNSSNLLSYSGEEALATHPPPFMVIQKRHSPSHPQITVSASAFVKTVYKALTWPTKEIQGLGEPPPWHCKGKPAAQAGVRKELWMVTVAFFLDLLVPNIPSECWQHPHPTATHSHFSKLESLESSLKDSGCGRGHRALVVGKQVAGSPLGGWGGKRNRSTKTS